MSVLSRLLSRLSSTLTNLITTPVRSYKNYSIRQKISYGSAAVLAFFVAPVAAMALGSESHSDISQNSTTTQITMPDEVPEAEVKAEASVLVESQASGGSSDDVTVTNNNGEVKAYVNGQEVAVPENGTVQQDGTTITTQRQSSGGNAYSSTTTINTTNSSVMTTSANGTTIQNHTFTGP